MCGCVCARVCVCMCVCVTHTLLPILLTPLSLYSGVQTPSFGLSPLFYSHPRTHTLILLFFSFFLSWVAKTQLNHWTKRVVMTQLTTHTYITCVTLFLFLPPSTLPLFLVGLAAHFSVDACVYTCPCVILFVCMFVCVYVCMYG